MKDLTTEDLDNIPCLLRNMVEANGKTIKQNNLARTHGIAQGTLVETEEGLRLWVTYQGRDCDGTPLYWLSFEKDLDQKSVYDRSKQTGGYSEDSLVVVEAREGGTIFLVLCQQTEGESVEYAFSTRELAEAKIKTFDCSQSLRVEEIDVDE